MRKYLWWIFCLAMLFISCSGFTVSKGSHILSASGTAGFIIVKPAAAIPSEITAAAELANYLGKATGAAFKVVSELEKVKGPRIIVGPSALSKSILGSSIVNKLGPEEFIVRSVGMDILIVGGRPRGTLYGVYSFLEKEIGCRWLTVYGDESVPHKATLILGEINRHESPSFETRDLCVQGAPMVIRPEVMKYLARNRDQGPDFNFLGDNTAYGGTSHRYGMPPGIWMVHTFFGWLSPAKYFEEHPDFYSLIGGKRVQSQLCFSNPVLRKTLTEKIVDQIGVTDVTGTYSLSAQDAAGVFCECPDCMALVKREGTPAAPLFDYLAELAPIVKAKYPKAFISTIAYRKGQSEIPPLKLKIPDNVIIVFAPIDDNFAHAIDHPSNAGTKVNLKKWSTKTKHLWIWYYPNPYDTVLPEGNFNRMASDFRLFKKVGVEGVFSEHDAGGIYESIGLVDMQTWVMTKLLWNPDQDLKSLVRDYSDRFYGPAAPEIRKYWSLLEKASSSMTTRMSWDASLAQHRYLNRDLITAGQKIFDTAEKKAAGNDDLLLRVRQARLSLDNAGILLYDQMNISASLPFTRNELIDRYRSTYTATKRKYLDKTYNAADSLYKWYGALTPIKPLPAPLAGIPESRIKQITTVNAITYPGCYMTKDPEAAAGVAAVTNECGGEIFETGFYDCLTAIQTNLKLKKDQIQPGAYNLYKIGHSRLNEQCYIWMGVSWWVQIRDIPMFYDPKNEKKEYDIYVSLKFEGKAYGTTDPTKQDNRVYMDRIILVAAE